MEHWRLQLTAILEWGIISKGLIPMTLALPVYTQYLLWGHYTLQRSDHAQLIHTDVMHTLMSLLYAMIGGTIFILLLGLWLIRQQQQSTWFQHLSALYFSVSMVVIGYFVGSMNFAAGVLVLGAPVFGFIILQRPVVWLAYGTALSLIIVLLICNTLSILPYAPLVVSNGSAESLLFWRNSLLSFAAPFLLVVTVLADYALALWRKRENLIRTLSQTDTLTGLYNRGTIGSRLDQEVARCIRHGHTMVVVLLDLDHFKSINDTWGHPTGDRVLQATAQTLNAHLRQTDALGRYGGEEFLLILPDSDVQGAIQLIERCRNQLAGMNIRSDTDDRVPVTASFGLARHDGTRAISAPMLIQQADQALYRAKRNGRDRFEVAETTTSIGVLNLL
jgi:diguanylate cyclase (GGDEF)-like protein